MQNFIEELVDELAFQLAHEAITTSLYDLNDGIPYTSNEEYPSPTRDWDEQEREKEPYPESPLVFTHENVQELIKTQEGHVKIESYQQRDQQISQYELKKIKYNNETIHIITQNQNGPCPLIALMNVLLLRNQIKIQKPSISNQEILIILVEYIIESQIHKFQSDENLYFTLDSVLKCVYLLEKGLNVNVYFKRSDGFEFTMEHSVFDICNIKLVHGWVVDFGDPRYELIANELKSYNRVVETFINSTFEDEELIGMKETNSIDVFDSHMSLVTTFPKHAKDKLLTEPEPNIQTSSNPTNIKQSILGQVEKLVDNENNIKAKDRTKSSEKIPKDKSSIENLKTTKEKSESLKKQSCEELLDSERQRGKSMGKFFDTKVTITEKTKSKSMNNFVTFPIGLETVGNDRKIKHKAFMDNHVKFSAKDLVRPPTRMKIVKGKSKESKVAVAKILNEFLNETATQLTLAGISSLKRTLAEDQPSILFRNNHFYTIIKRNNQLFTLVTDNGYLTTPNIIWETLDIKGDSELLGDDFRTDRLNEMDIKNFEIDLNADFDLGFEIKNDFEIAKELQEEEYRLGSLERVNSGSRIITATFKKSQHLIKSEKSEKKGCILQ